MAARAVMESTQAKTASATSSFDRYRSQTSSPSMEGAIRFAASAAPGPPSAATLYTVGRVTPLRHHQARQQGIGRHVGREHGEGVGGDGAVVRGQVPEGGRGGGGL